MQSAVIPPRRVRLIVNWEVQSSVVVRCVIYGAACTTYFSFMLICTQWAQAPDQPFADVIKRCGEDIVYWLPGLLILAPLAIHDLLRATEKSVGPVVRLQNEMKLLLRGKSERPIRFRDDDHWPELGPIYNQVRGELLLLRRQLAEYEATAQTAAVVDELPLKPDPGAEAVRTPAGNDQPIVDRAVVEPATPA